MEISEFLGLVGTLTSVFGGFATWYWGTKKKRLIKAIKEQQTKIETVADYTNGTGYKLILRDCFHLIAYSISIVFIVIGVSLLLSTIISNPQFKIFLIQITSAVFLGSGILLFELFLVLSKTFKSKESLEVMNKKLGKLQSKHENI